MTTQSHQRYLFHCRCFCFYALFRCRSDEFRFPLCSEKCLQQTPHKRIPQKCILQPRSEWVFQTFLHLEENGRTKSFEPFITWEILPLLCREGCFLSSSARHLPFEKLRLTFLLFVLLGCCCSAACHCLKLLFRYVQSVCLVLKFSNIQKNNAY